MNGKRAKELRKQAVLYVGVKDLKELDIPGLRLCQNVTNKKGKFLGFRFKDGPVQTVTDFPTICKYTYKALKKYYKRNFVKG